jgi:hypothetical protein
LDICDLLAGWRYFEPNASRSCADASAVCG